MFGGFLPGYILLSDILLLIFNSFDYNGREAANPGGLSQAVVPVLTVQK